MITTLVIESREVLLAGQRFGDVGQYEKLRGYAIGELDPLHPLNAGIVNIDKAPRNGNGRVEYRVDVEIHKPVNLQNGNGTLLYDVVNRGIRLVPTMLGVDFNHGFTFVWSGWEIDDNSENRALQHATFPNEEPLKAELPVATQGGQSFVGLSREEFVDIGMESVTRTLFYPAHELDQDKCSLTVRQTQEHARTQLPNSNWQFISDSEIRIAHPGPPYDAGAIFEFIYPARDPIVAAVGFAATRDLNAFLRYQKHDSAGNPNPLKQNGEFSIKRAIIDGISQSGRFVRDFLWQGFNQAESGEKVFDGAFSIVGGSRKTWTNFPFAQPGRVSRQHEDHLQPGDQFPFAYGSIEDPLTGVTDGILTRCVATNTCPKIMHLDSESEVWDARGSLLITDGNPLGPATVPIPDNVRLYMVAGTAHNRDSQGSIIATDPMYGVCKHQHNPQGSVVVARALLLALNVWITDGKSPPESRYGSVTEPRSFVAPDQANTGFPDIPGVSYTGQTNYLKVTDYSKFPPVEGRQYGILVSRVDRDGNALAGIRLPALAVPIGTYTGWNLRRAGHGEGDLCGFYGSFIPFARTAAERRKRGDPRLSIEERYGTHERYVTLFNDAANTLVDEGFLLRGDADNLVAQATSESIKKLFPQ